MSSVSNTSDGGDDTPNEDPRKSSTKHSMTISEREARVNRDHDGNILGVTLFIEAEALPNVVTEQKQDRITYIVREERVVLKG